MGETLTGFFPAKQGDFSCLSPELHPTADLLSSMALVSQTDTMNNRQRALLELVFNNPVPRTLDWSRLESLLVSLGARVVEGRGSRVRFELNG
ncbi:hypothetical protein EMIT047CA2_80281 [Pseudomonas soli]